MSQPIYSQWQKPTCSALDQSDSTYPKPNRMEWKTTQKNPTTPSWFIQPVFSLNSPYYNQRNYTHCYKSQYKYIQVKISHPQHHAKENPFFFKTKSTLTCLSAFPVSVGPVQTHHKRYNKDRNSPPKHHNKTHNLQPTPNPFVGQRPVLVVPNPKAQYNIYAYLPTDIFNKLSFLVC